MSRRKGSHYRKYLRQDGVEAKIPSSTWRRWLANGNITVERLKEMGINPVQRRRTPRQHPENVTDSANEIDGNGVRAQPSSSGIAGHGFTNCEDGSETLPLPTSSAAASQGSFHPSLETQTLCVETPLRENCDGSTSTDLDESVAGNVVADLDGSIISVSSFDVNEVSDISDDEYFDAEEREENCEHFTFEDSKFIGFEALNAPLIPTLTVTKFETLVMILHIAMRHGMTDVLLEDLMGFVNQVVGVPDALPKSKYLFNKLFMGGTQPTVHFYCPRCNVYLAPSTSFTNGYVTCEGCDLLERVSSLNKGNYFLTLSLRHQIKDVLHRPHLNIISKEQRLSGVISDIMDGKVYKSLQKDKGVLSNPNALTITFATDGSPVFKNGSNSLWPLHFHINEIDPKQRFQVDNMLLAGLWFGEHEPKMQIFLQPFVQELQELSKCGVVWKKTDGSIVESPVYALCCCTDSVAKPKVQNIMQYNGSFGCGYCSHPNLSFTIYERVNPRQGFTTAQRIDPYQPNENENANQAVFRKRTMMRYLRGDYRLRTDKELREQMQLVALSETQHIMGATGISVLFPLFYFHMVFGFSIDYMHAILLGVVKRLANLWFDSTSKDEPYYIGRLVHLIDRRLAEITVPSHMRRPRPMSDRCHWKANEWRVFLLYYGLPCLANILPSEYYNHFKKLVTAIFILTKESILFDEIEEAHKLLQEFVWEYEGLYGKTNMVYNVHISGHLAIYVSKMGPLWAYSSFPFESANGRFVRMAKGTRGVATQIARKYLMTCTTSKLVRSGYTVRDEVFDYCSRVIGYQYVSKVLRVDDVTLLGNGSVFSLDDQCKQALLDRGLDIVSNVTAFNRAVVRGTLYRGLLSARRSKANDSCVRLDSGQFAIIELIFKTHTHPHIIWCLVKKLNVSTTLSPLMVPHIKQCCLDPYGDMILVTFDEIIKKCIFFSCNDKYFVTKFSNTFEKD